MSRFFKPPKPGIRLGVDGAMILLFVTSLAFRATGRQVHEWGGTALCTLFIVHNIWNWRWYRNFFSGRYTCRRAVNAITNLSLVAAMTVLCVCGILNSRHTFGFSHFIDGENVRQIHSLAAYWGLVLIGFHTGLHWDMIIGTAGKAFPRGGGGKIPALLLKPAAALFVAVGVWASFDRDMGSKLFLGFSFDFWDPERPLMLFYACNLSILGVYVFIARLVHKALRFSSGKAALSKQQIQGDNA